jgi:hypothetical protein
MSAVRRIYTRVARIRREFQEMPDLNTSGFLRQTENGRVTAA